MLMTGWGEVQGRRWRGDVHGLGTARPYSRDVHGLGTARPYCYEDGGAMPLGRIFIGTIQIRILDHNQLHIFEVSIGIHL